MHRNKLPRLHLGRDSRSWRKGNRVRAQGNLLCRRVCGAAVGLSVGFGVDFEEVVEDDEEHGHGAEENGEAEEVVVGNHIVWNWYVEEVEVALLFCCSVVLRVRLASLQVAKEGRTGGSWTDGPGASAGARRVVERLINYQ